LPEIDNFSVVSNTGCSGGTAALGSVEITLVDGTSTFTNYTFTWYQSDGTTQIAAANIINGATNGTSAATGIVNLADGNYIVDIVNTSTGNCSTRQTVQITNDPVTPFIEFYEANRDLGCDVNTGSFVLSGVRYNGNTITDSTTLADGYTLEFSDGTTTFSPLATSPLQYDSLDAGQYSVTITDKAGNCSANPLTFTIEANPFIPELQIVQVEADSTCTGGTANGTLLALADNASGNATYSYSWFNVDASGARVTPAIATTDTLHDQFAGTYEVEVTNTLLGCSATGQFTLTNDPIQFDFLSIAITAPTSCSPANGLIVVESMTHGVVDDYTFQFYKGDPASGGILVQGGASDSLTTAEPGETYFVQAVHTEFGCTSLAFEATMTEDNISKPVISLAFDAFGQSVSKNNTSCDPAAPTGVLSVTTNGSTDLSLYSWSWNNGATTAQIDSLVAGTYTVTTTVLATGCTAAESFNIVEDFLIPLTINTSTSPNTNCVNPNGRAAASVLNINDNPEYRGLDYAYYWYIGDNQNPDPAQADYVGASVDSLVNGIYTVYVVDNQVNCFTSDPILVEVIDETSTPTLGVEILSNMTICYEDRPNGIAQIVAPNNDLFRYNLSWYVGTDPTGLNPFSTGFQADSMRVGTYTVVVTDVLTGCEQLIPFEITDETPFIPTPQVIIAQGRTDCVFPNGEVILNVAGETDGYLFEWFLSTDLINPVFTGSKVSTLDVTSYQVVATHLASGCTSGVVEFSIPDEQQDPEFVVDIKQSLCLRTEDGSTNQFSGEAFIQFIQPTNSDAADTIDFTFTGIDSIVWYDNTGFPISNEFKLVDASPGSYSVEFWTDLNCHYTAEFELEPSMKIYNGMSPNGDGLNDFFLLDCVDLYPNNNVKIFTRDGIRVYEMDFYNNLSNRFEGESNVGNGKRLPAGTYFYIIDRGDGTELLQGFLELVR
jgi:gliding motility-associated-like protein